MKTQVKIEVVIESIQESRVISLLKETGLSGYSIIRDVGGFGSHGMHETGSRFTDTHTNSYIFSVCSQERAEEFSQRLQPMLKKFGGICFMSDVNMVVVE